MNIVLLQTDKLLLLCNFENQIWKLETISFQMIYSLSTLLKIFTEILF